MNSDGSSPESLGPLKVRRSYNCEQCGLLTSNPREFLYHLRDSHGEKISIFECKYCIYASKHVQKLQRHCGLVHRQLIAEDPEFQKQLEASKERRARPVVTQNNLDPSNAQNSKNSPKFLNSKPVRKTLQLPFKCSACPYQTRNKSFLTHHEKTVHLKKKFYRCLQCGYVTNEKARYSKHIKYHSLPKMQCQFCYFKTAYKWNMERHMKNHEEGAEGAFRCTICNFTTSTKQSFKSHVTNHHNNPETEEFSEQNGEAENGEMEESAEWEDVEEAEYEEENNVPTGRTRSSSYEFPETRETPDAVWKDGKIYQKNLQCKICDFKAAWPFELKKHEENHRSQKKHPCPLCGMRFEHLAWLTKHLRRVHHENSQAKNIAAAFELLKPNRRRPSNKESTVEAVLPVYQEVLKQNHVANTKPAESAKTTSMLSTLLNKPLQPIAQSLSKFNPQLKPRPIAPAINPNRQLRLANYYEKPQESQGIPKSKGVPTCNVCGYKTRWISELQRHMRVHSQEKPFHCHKCKYVCKWKGDLNRHLMKYHGIKVLSPNRKLVPQAAVPKLKFRKAPSVANDWQSVSAEPTKRHFTSSTPARNPEGDAPLDLTNKETFPNAYPLSHSYDPYDFERLSSATEEQFVDVETFSETDSSGFRSSLPAARELSFSADVSSSPGAKRKYQCPFCSFGTTTASRFHVHIVQHYNRRPFMCSVCGFNSNWEFDITKHIRLRNCRDQFNNKACVLLTHESGKRNYDKYEKYLVDINQPPPAVPPRPPPDVLSASSPQHTSNKPPPVDPSTKSNCSYDFRNIGSNFEEAPENIVVTPDINFSEPLESLDSSQEFYDDQSGISNQTIDSTPDVKSFFCKHCNFKHGTKRVVISHLSVHAGIKPFRCRACGIASNWRHVIVRHVKDAHNGYMNEVEDRISYVQEGFGVRLTSVGSPSHGSAAATTTHMNVPQFGCKLCPYKCDKEFYIKFHMKQHRPREGAIYRCDYCPYFVKFKKTLVRHMILHTGQETDNGTGENLELDEFESSANSHMNGSTSSEGVYNFYGSQNESEDSIVISFDALSQFCSDPVSPQKIKRHVCESCPYKTDNKTQYLYHKQFHRPNSSAPFKCTVCSYWATMQHLLTQHMKVHSGAEHDDSGSKAGSAASSPDKFDSDSDWMDKMSVVYVKRGEDTIKMFKCKFCPMMNKKKANVRVHQKMHGVIVNNGKFACSYCDYQCLNQGGLTNHLKMHQKVPEKEAIVEESQGTFHSTQAEQPQRKFFSYFCDKCPALFKSHTDLDVHSRFHGSSLPFPCEHCDYRARNRPHLFKHMTVHSSEYISKRNAAQRPPLGKDGDLIDPMLEVSDIPLVKKIDQMLLLEASEMSKALKKTGEVTALLQKCMFCPAPFFKASTLTYHISLHGSDGEFKCTQCDYAVNRQANLSIHSQVHPKKKLPPKPKKAPLRTWTCTRCPAVFYKQDRFDRHSELHGKNYRFVCEHCDYSVRFAANLIKHRKVHEAHKQNAENNASPEKASDVAAVSQTPTAIPLAENTNILEGDEKKITYICDRCPYFQSRRDAVQSHQRRHWFGDGFKCPYCDYTSMQNGFIQNHIKLHIQPQQLFNAQAFMRYESFKIFCRNEGEDEEELLFDDQEMPKERLKKKRKSEESSERKKIRKLSREHSANPGPSDSVHKPKVPVVVLSDILADKDFRKWAPKLKIPKLKIMKCTDASSSEKTFSKINISYDSKDSLQSCLKPKPSLVVKISKLDCSNKDKAVYSVSTKTSEPVVHAKAIVKQAELPDLPFDDSATEMNSTSLILPNSTSPTELESHAKECEVPTATSEVVSEAPEEAHFELCVPGTSSDNLSDKVHSLSNSSSTKECSMTNGESDTHVSNGLTSNYEEKM